MRRAVTAAGLVVALVATWLGLSPCGTRELGDAPDTAPPPRTPMLGRQAPSPERRDRPRAATDGVTSPDVAASSTAADAAPTSSTAPPTSAATPTPAPAAARAKPPATPLAVLVLHADGTPAPGAVVTAYGGPVVSAWEGPEVRPMYTETAVAGEGGRATLPPRGRMFGALRAVWNDVETGAAAGGAGDAAELVVRLRPAVVLRGRVEDPDGVGIAGATCRMMWHPGPEETTPNVGGDATSGPGGEFAFVAMPRLEGKGAATLGVTAPQYLARRLYLPAAKPPEGTVTVRLERALTLRGRCVDESGAPVAEAVAWASAPHDGAFRVDTAADGRFELTPLDPRRHTILIERRGLVTVEVKEFAARDGVLDLGDVVLRRGAEIGGTVHGPDGRPVAGLSVSARSPRFPNAPAFGRTDGAGRFAIRGLPDGTYTVAAQTDWHSPVPRESAADVATGMQDVRLVVAGTVCLRFVSVDDGKPVRVPVGWYRIVSGPRGPCDGRVWHEDAPGPEVISTALDGPGTYTLTVDAIGLEEARVESVTVVADRNVEVDVPIRAKHR